MASSDDSPDGQITLVEKPTGSRNGDGPARTETLTDVLRAKRWRLSKLNTIAGGGFGAVDLALDEVLQRRLAMKIVHPDMQRDKLTLQLFAREAMITAQLDHPNIVPVHDVGCDNEDRPYFTMKLVNGQTLAHLVNAQETPLRWDTLRNRIEIVIKVCDAVSFAHSRGVLHCDIKSDNIMVGDFGQVYLMDWGAAKLMNDSALAIEGPMRDAVGLLDFHLPHDECVLGTPGYMSPEQTLGDRSALDQRADVFSLGALLYHIVTGRPPYPSGPSDASGDSARDTHLIPLSQTGVSVPAELERVVMKALSADRDDRHSSVAELRDELVAFARGHSGFPQSDYAEGEIIIAAGDQGDAAYIIVSGRCEVFETIDGKRKTLRKMSVGEVFGEAAVLSPGPRTASVMACEPTTVLVIDQAELQAEVQELKPWLASVLRTLAARFRDAESARAYAESEQSTDHDPMD